MSEITYLRNAARQLQAIHRDLTDLEAKMEKKTFWVVIATGVLAPKELQIEARSSIDATIEAINLVADEFGSDFLGDVKIRVTRVFKPAA
jgi:hypothetical protein